MKESNHNLSAEQLCFRLGKFHEFINQKIDVSNDIPINDVIYDILDEFDRLFNEINT